MEGMVSEAIKALGPYPLVQGAAVIIILLGGIYLMSRGSKDSGTIRESIPQWQLMGPFHDMMAAVHDIAEEAHQNNKTMERIEVIFRDILREIEKIKAVVEDIRNP